jgi:hypothetical protein
MRFSAGEVFENTEGILESIYERLPNPSYPPLKKKEIPKDSPFELSIIYGLTA